MENAHVTMWRRTIIFILLCTDFEIKNKISMWQANFTSYELQVNNDVRLAVWNIIICLMLDTFWQKIIETTSVLYIAPLLY